MKTILAILSAAILCGCSTTTNPNAANAYAKYGAAIRPGVALAGRAVLTLAVQPQDRADVAADMYAVSAVVRSLSYGTTPTPDQLQKSIALATPKSKEWAGLAATIFSLYGGVYPSIQGNPKLALQVLGDIADGCNDAAAGFIPAPTP